jgi:hypothetical protein
VHVSLTLRFAWGQMSRMYANTYRMTWLDVSFGRKIGRRYHFLSFPIPHVPILIQNKIDEAKNKVRKTQEQN